MTDASVQAANTLSPAALVEAANEAIALNDNEPAKVQVIIEIEVEPGMSKPESWDWNDLVGGAEFIGYVPVSNA